MAGSQWSGRGVEEYYQKFIELQERLRKSEEERLQLELKFNNMIQVTQEEEQLYCKRLKSQYRKFMDENRKRQERNEHILRMLEHIENRAAMFEAKSKRFRLLRNQYQTFLQRIEHERNLKGIEERRETNVKGSGVTLNEFIDYQATKPVRITENATRYDLGNADQLYDIHKHFTKPSNEETEMAEDIMRTIHARYVRRNAPGSLVKNMEMVKEVQRYAAKRVTVEDDTDESSTEGTKIGNGDLIPKNGYLTKEKEEERGIVNSSNEMKNDLELDKMNFEHGLQQSNLNSDKKIVKINNGEESVNKVDNYQNSLKVGNEHKDGKEIQPVVKQIGEIKVDLPDNSVKNNEYNIRYPINTVLTGTDISENSKSLEYVDENQVKPIHANKSDCKDLQETDQEIVKLQNIGRLKALEVDPEILSKNVNESENIEMMENSAEEALKQGVQYLNEENIDINPQILEPTSQQLNFNNSNNEDANVLFEERGEITTTTVEVPLEEEGLLERQLQVDTIINSNQNEENVNYNELGEPIQYDENDQQVYYDENGKEVVYDTNSQDYNYNNQQYDETGQPIAYDANYQNYQYDENGQIVDYANQHIAQEDGNIYYDENSQAMEYNQEEVTNFANAVIPEGNGYEQSGADQLQVTESNYEATEVVVSVGEIEQKPQAKLAENSLASDSSKMAQLNVHEGGKEVNIVENVAQSSNANVMELLDTESESSLDQQGVKQTNESDFDFSSTSDAK